MKPTILIADDEPSMLELINAILENQGYNLEFASNGEQVIQKASVLNPDLILLDIMMPDMDGIKVCETLRRDKKLGEIPIVIVSALDDRDIRIASIEAGVDDFIAKPIDRAELRARVRSITRLNRYRRSYEKSLVTSWIVEKSSDGYLQLDSQDKVLYANSRARFYLGLDMDTTSPIPDTFMEIVKRQYILQPASAWGAWPVSVTIKSNPLYLVRPESRTAHEFWLELDIHELAGADGRVKTRVVRMHDVTTRIRTNRNTRSFGEAITHKIRTPITQILTSLDLLSRHIAKMSQEEAAKISTTALSGAKRLHETLNQILRYSNLSFDPQDGEGFTVSELNQLAASVSVEVGLKNISISIPHDLAGTRIALPQQSLEVILWEILGNSRKFHPDRDPKVSIEVSNVPSKGILIRIGDNGMTLSPRQLSIAFLPYYQGEKDFTGEAPGMGLGLATVSSIVWGVGGACRISNQKDGPGVVIELLIPEVSEENLYLAVAGGLNGRD